MLKDDERVGLNHEIISEILEYAINVDQLDITNLSSFECALRHLQVMEGEVKRKSEAKRGFDSNEYFLGRSRRTGGALVCPALTKWGAEKASADSAILKEQRKATEERALHKEKK
jgi:hypothetical protein